ncbi:ABC transporter ATP-binding protein [Metamycoplasma hyosynoviae]|uniref:ABC transporter ATP-binding protein n=1 Tax=Metamycoplasma hyosynoviae TaxID=29559 RepID=UPI00236101F7|nr:ABC transporter ATP-binding protein [Metamycoplasma hyosynoviae]MDD1360342.1 ABC transporter ATP-binding protein [Metamycoplasma hyosynoviae]
MPENNETVIEFKNVTKIFQNLTALNNVSFQIKKGQFHGFIGANGAGKTTLFRSILGFYPDVKGEILINGKSWKDISFKEKIGYIPEVAMFPKKLTVLEYLEIFAGLSNIPWKEIRPKVFQLLEHYNITSEIYNKNGNNLSSGQKKKILLIQALLNDPEILILDEPAANLDPKIRVELYESLKELAKKGKTIFVSSHILTELQEYIDSFTVLDKGNVVETSTIEGKISKSNYKFTIESDEVKAIEEILKNVLKITKTKNLDKFELKENIFLIMCGQDEFDKILLEIIKQKIPYKFAGKYIPKLNDIYFDVLKAE